MKWMGGGKKAKRGRADSHISDQEIENPPFDR
jgi:hypothetical protein